MLADDETSYRPFWEQHAGCAAQAIQSAGFDEPCFLVGHSGAGPLLPAIASRLSLSSPGFIFVDAMLPAPHSSRLDMLRLESERWAGEFEQYLARGGRFPDWRDEDLAILIPYKDVRRQALAELKPRGLPFFNEPIFVPEGWSETPGGYVQFTAAFDYYAEQARQWNWPLIQLAGGHFQMLVEPRQVAEAIIEIAMQL
jgi:hypothetical protein